MPKTRKRGKQKQVKIKHKSKRLGRGLEEALPFLLREKLNNVSESTYNKEFYEPTLVSHILRGVPRAAVTEAIENASYKKEVERLLRQKFKRSANSRAIANKIVSTIPTRHITIGRKKQDLTNELKIAQAALDAYIVASQLIHDRKEELFNKLGDLEDERDELEKVIGQSKLDKYDDLKNKYDELNRSKSMLKRSRASLIKIRLETLRFGPIGKLYALIDKIEKLDQIYTKANENDITAYEEEDRLTLIVHNLKTQIEDLEDL
jgi:hypothetical protein